MQTFGLPRHVTRGAALKRWQRARDNGLSAAAAADAVGVSRATLYRWRNLRHRRRLAPQSRRPHHPRRPAWSPVLVKAVHDMRTDYPMWGKAKLTILLRRQGYSVCESTTGRILKRLVDKGAVSPVPTLRRKAPRAARRSRPHVRRLPKGRKPTAPGEIIQLDTLSLTLDSGRPPIKQFTACDPVTKWTCAQACRNATAHNAKRFLDKLQADMPFPIHAIQVDGGSEFKADFERECQKRGIDLFELPRDPPNSTAMSNATTAPGDTSSTQHGTCPTTTSKTSTNGSTPSPTSSTPSVHTTHSTDVPPPSTFSH